MTDPRIIRSRERIMTAALACFLADGYRTTTVEAIAAAAGVSTKTVYNVFGAKEALFRAVVQAPIAIAEEYAGRLATSIRSPEDLSAAMTELAATVISERVVALRQLLIAELHDFPDLAADYYRRGPGRVLRRLADALAALHGEGLLDVPDPAVAAEQLAFLVLGAGLDEALMSPHGSPPDPDLAQRRARAGVETFLRAHAARAVGDQTAGRSARRSNSTPP